MLRVIIMSQKQILFLLITFLGFHNSHAQIFIGDDDAAGILWAPLPDPKDDTNIMDTSFTLIPLPAGSKATDIGYDPSQSMVYWCDFTNDEIGRIQIDGTNQEDIISTNSPTNIALDLVNGKIYWTMYNDRSIAQANLDGTEVEVIYTHTGFVQPVAILVDPVNEYVLWSTRIVNQLMRAGLDGSNAEIVAEFYPEAMIDEQCADGSARLFYYTNAGTLGVIGVDGNNDQTLAVVPVTGYGNTLNKYGAKLIWKVQTQSGNSIHEYDVRTSEFKMHNTTRTTDGDMTINPGSIRIFADVTYDEPVAVEGCPESFTITLAEGATSTQVSWPEPMLNRWSSCPSMELNGDINNGDNVTAFVYDELYMASDTAGNKDVCQFAVTVLDSGDEPTLVTVPPSQVSTSSPKEVSTSSPKVTLSGCNQSGSGTTFFSSTTILRTLGITILFVVALG